MENISSEIAVYNVLDDNVAFNLESKGSEYQSLGYCDYPTTGIYDSVEEPTMYVTPIYINETDSKDDKNNTQVCKRVVRNKTERFVTQRICIGLLVAMTVLLFISLLVMVYIFVFSKSKSEGGNTRQDSGHCLEQTHVENGKVVNTTGSSYGDVVEIECDERSQLIGSNLITCLSSGKWSSVPNCVAKKCVDFVLTNNMLLESKEEDPVVGTKIVVTCTEGFEIHGKKTIICQFDKSWSGRPICKAIDCGMPKNIANAKITGLIKTTYNRTFSVRCNEGYRLEGSKTVSCQANGLWATCATCTKELNDCLDLLNEGGITIDGIYSITTWKSRQQRQVYCDMTTSGGGWTLFQYRYDGSVDFYRNFSEYENGFGSQDGEFWLGLRLIRELASLDTTELRIDVSSADNTTGFETFQNFTLAESPDYTINFESGESNMVSAYRYLGLNLNKGCRFSTYDHDADMLESHSCAEHVHGAWWYGNCGGSNLNGHYAVPGTQSDYHADAEYRYLGLKLNKGCRFSTYDHDAETLKSHNCAEDMHGAWWYEKCGGTNLNGHYAVPGKHSYYHITAGMIYYPLEKNYLSLKTSKLMFRRAL